MLGVGFTVVSERREGVFYRGVPGMFWTAGASLDMREKRAAFPRHVKVFITICVRLIHTPDVAAPVAVVCLDTLTIWFCRSPGEVSVSPPPRWDDLRSDLPLVTEISQIWRCILLNRRCITSRQNSSRVSNKSFRTSSSLGHLRLFTLCF